jgi:AcrR family transcriptional regulator
MTRAARLPRGRHELSRAQVAASQRGRMLRAVADAMTELGYVNTSVAEIIKRAGVSRETFYEQFASKQECFAAALEATMDNLGAVMTTSLGSHGTPLARFDRALAAYLDALAADPATARLFLIETYAAGPEVMRRRLELQQLFVDGIAGVFGATAADRFVCEALVAAVVGMVTGRMVHDDVAGLRELRAPLVELAGRLLVAGISPRP